MVTTITMAAKGTVETIRNIGNFINQSNDGNRVHSNDRESFVNFVMKVTIVIQVATATRVELVTSVTMVM
jgi:hypothetical protein